MKINISAEVLALIVMVIVRLALPIQPHVPAVPMGNISAEVLALIAMVIVRLAVVLQLPAPAVKMGGIWSEQLVIHLAIFHLPPQCQME